MPDPNITLPGSQRSDQLEYQALAPQPNPGVPPVGQPFLADPVLPIADAPLTTAGADQPQLFPASAVDAHPVVAAVIGSVQATSEPHNWAMTAATVLQALAPLQGQVFQASRASAKTQMQVNLAEVGVVTLAGILQMFFPHPRAG